MNCTPLACLNSQHSRDKDEGRMISMETTFDAVCLVFLVPKVMGIAGCRELEIPPIVPLFTVLCSLWLSLLLSDQIVISTLTVVE